MSPSRANKVVAVVVLKMKKKIFEGGTKLGVKNQLQKNRLQAPIGSFLEAQKCLAH